MPSATPSTTAYRKQMFSPPDFIFVIGDLVLCRTTPADHEFQARVVGVTTEGRPRYDVIDRDGRLHLNVPDIRLDEDAMRGAA